MQPSCDGKGGGGRMSFEGDTRGEQVRRMDILVRVRMYLLVCDGKGRVVKGGHGVERQPADDKVAESRTFSEAPATVPLTHTGSCFRASHHHHPQTHYLFERTYQPRIPTSLPPPATGVYIVENRDVGEATTNSGSLSRQGSHENVHREHRE